MLDHFSNSSLIPFTLLVTSLLGSWHCAGMCGAIACSPTLQNKSLFYHIGRLISYSALGFTMGWLGMIATNTTFESVQKISGLLIAFILIGVGTTFLINSPRFSSINLPPYFLRFFKKSFQIPLLLGILTGLLPCGWLYSFVAIAAGSKSPTNGALIMFLFWIGTVPALSVMSKFFLTMSSVTKGRLRQLVGLLLIISGTYSVAMHFINPDHL